MNTQQRKLIAAMSLCTGILVAASGPAQAALIASADGQTVYDTDRNITWLSNANLAATNAFGLSYGVDYGTDQYGNQTIIYSDGSMTSAGALLWVNAMNAANYLGYNDWRLPANDTCYGYNCTGSDMGHLFYNELGGAAGSLLTSTHNANYSLFQNVQTWLPPTPYGYSLPASYWSGTMTMRPWQAVYFGIDGSTTAYIQGNNAFTMVVRDGQVAAVPVPAAAWLFGSGLLGLIGVARRKAA